mmetsp:Transcript_102368/g.298471  ORF Transcript_102368/g.298471 Transcript_102368/m.298471 type:complete len:368 (+) Transcript_102368:78-1181(+)
MGRSPDATHVMPILLGQMDYTSAGRATRPSKSPHRQRPLVTCTHARAPTDAIGADGEKQGLNGAEAGEGLGQGIRWNLEDEIEEVAQHCRALGSAFTAQNEEDDIFGCSIALPEIHAITKRLAVLLEAVTEFPDKKSDGSASLDMSTYNVKVRTLLFDVARLMRRYQRPLAAAVEARSAEGLAEPRGAAGARDDTLGSAETKPLCRSRSDFRGSTTWQQPLAQAAPGPVQLGPAQPAPPTSGAGTRTPGPALAPAGLEGSRTIRAERLSRSPSARAVSTPPRSQYCHASTGCLRSHISGPAPAWSRGTEAVNPALEAKSSSDEGSVRGRAHAAAGAHPWRLRYAPKALPSPLRKSVLLRSREAGVLR